jgi:hypothetical protein
MNFNASKQYLEQNKGGLISVWFCELLKIQQLLTSGVTDPQGFSLNLYSKYPDNS